MAMTRTHSASKRLRPGGSQRSDQRHEQKMTASAETETLTEREASFFHLLAHPARLALLDALRDDAACVCHLEALLGYPQAYISQQLAVLRSAGVIEGRREGWNVYYHVCDTRLFTVLDAALDLLIPSDPATSARPTKREAGPIVPGCACPHCSTTTPVSAAHDMRPATVDKQENL